MGALTDADKADILKIVDGYLAEREPFKEGAVERVLRPCELRSLKIREYPWVIATKARLLCASLACLGHCCQANVKASAAWLDRCVKSVELISDLYQISKPLAETFHSIPTHFE